MFNFFDVIVIVTVVVALSIVATWQFFKLAEAEAEAVEAEVTLPPAIETIAETATEAVAEAASPKERLEAAAGDLIRRALGQWDNVGFLWELPLANVERSTTVLGTDTREWPLWIQGEDLFLAVLTACKATPADLQAGILPAEAYKALRAAGLESKVRGRELKAMAELVRLPMSPKVMGVLKACKASQESINAFENRGAKAQDVVYYVSNEAAPLIQIGNWGQAHYRSCQAWDQTNHRHSYSGQVALKAFGLVSEPDVFVAWAGAPQEMVTRVILRKMTTVKGWKFPEGTPVIVMERWYGDAGYAPVLTAHLKAWAKAQGYALGQSCTHETAESYAKTADYDVLQGKHAVHALPYLDNGHAETYDGKDASFLGSAFCDPDSKIRTCAYFTMVGE